MSDTSQLENIFRFRPMHTPIRAGEYTKFEAGRSFVRTLAVQLRPDDRSVIPCRLRASTFFQLSLRSLRVVNPPDSHIHLSTQHRPGPCRRCGSHAGPADALRQLAGSECLGRSARRSCRRKQHGRAPNSRCPQLHAGAAYCHFCPFRAGCCLEMGTKSKDPNDECLHFTLNHSSLVVRVRVHTVSWLVDTIENWHCVDPAYAGGWVYGRVRYFAACCVRGRPSMRHSLRHSNNKFLRPSHPRHNNPSHGSRALSCSHAHPPWHPFATRPSPPVP